MLKKVSQLKNHAGFRRYAANTSWLVGEKILRMFVGIFVGVWVARYLGPEQYGLLSYAQSFVFLFAVIATLGLDHIVVRELVKDESRRDELLGTAFGLKFMGAVVLLPLLGLGVLLTSNDPYTNLLVFIIASATIFQSLNVIDFYFQAKVLSKYTALANTISLAASSIIKIVLILYEGPLIAFAIITAFEAIILAAGIAFYYSRFKELNIFKWNFQWITAKMMLQHSWPLILSGLVVSIYMKFDQVMVKEMLDASAVGQYSAAVRISEAWYFIPMAISNSLFPAIINAKQQDEKIYEKRLKRLYRLMFWIAISIAIPMTFLSDWLIEFLYGIQYAQAGDLLMIHIWAGVFVFLGVAINRWFLVENLQKFTMVNTTIGAIINVTLNYFLISRMGVAGAAWATLISYGIASYLSMSIFNKTRQKFVFVTKSCVTFN